MTEQELQAIEARVDFFRSLSPHAPVGHSIEPSDVEALIAEVRALGGPSGAPLHGGPSR